MAIPALVDFSDILGHDPQVSANTISWNTNYMLMSFFHPKIVKKLDNGKNWLALYYGMNFV